MGVWGVELKSCGRFYCDNKALKIVLVMFLNVSEFLGWNLLILFKGLVT